MFFYQFTNSTSGKFIDFTFRDHLTECYHIHIIIFFMSFWRCWKRAKPHFCGTPWKIISCAKPEPAKGPGTRSVVDWNVQKGWKRLINVLSSSARLFIPALSVDSSLFRSTMIWVLRVRSKRKEHKHRCGPCNGIQQYGWRELVKGGVVSIRSDPGFWPGFGSRSGFQIVQYSYSKLRSKL